MKKLIFSIIIILSVSCGNSADRETDKIFAAYRGAVPGAAVMVIRNGKIIFNKGYGLADVEEKKPVADSTNFRLASVTKQFTAMCILQLIEKNKLSFDTKLKELFPELPDFAEEISVENLLRHTGGLADYEDLIPDTAAVQLKDRDVLNLISQTDSTYFAPGSQHRYSNTGYAILSLIVEKISGLPFREYLRKNIFAPLGMKNTLAYEKGINEIPNRAFGYTITDTGITRTDQSITSAVLGDGGIYSSVKDLAKWDSALYGDKLIPHKFIEDSFTRGALSNGEKFDYGLGWRLEKFDGFEIVYHTGSTEGFRNIIYRIPEKKFTVIILTNRNTSSEFSTLDLAHKVIRQFLN